jgi:serine/threonine-protein kinase
MTQDLFGLVGQTIDGQYRVERPIGEGGFSIVYRGTHVGLGEPIAIKCLKLTAAQDTEAIESFMKRFRDEGRLQYRLGQGNLDIVRCINSGTLVSATTGALVPYLVLEWLDGRSLAVDLRARRSRGMRGRPLEEVFPMFEPGALALDYAHKLGVVHRDVKPGNLFLANRGGATRMKVLDFGLAKILDETIGITMAATMGSVMMCSPRYAAPEQFDPKVGTIGPWTDVFSLGMVLLEVLRDERVRKGEGIVACMNEALDPKASLSATALGLRLPSRVELALARATALDIRTRQQSAGELWSDLVGAMRRRNDPLSMPSVQMATVLGVGLVGEPSTRSPASIAKAQGPLPMAGPVSDARTTIDPPWQGPPSAQPPSSTGFGGTVVMPDAPPRVQPGQGVATPPPPTQPLPPTRPFPNLAPALAAPPQPPVYVQPPPAPGSHPFPPVSVPLSSSGRRPSRAPAIVFLLLFLLGILAAGGFFAWRAWKIHGGFHLSSARSLAVGCCDRG